MNIHYIILAHKNPRQLLRLVSKLQEPWTKFYIHIDKHCEIEEFKQFFNLNDSVIFIEEKEREYGTWGDIGIVRATLNAINKVIEKDQPGICYLLSGQDYPISSNMKILNFFQNNPNTNFISSFSLPYEGWNETGLNRIEKYKFNKSLARGKFFVSPSIYEKGFFNSKNLRNVAYLWKNKRYKDFTKLLQYRKFPKYIRPYGGSVYWTLTTETLVAISNFLKHHPDYVKYHENTLCADEIFFHSIIKNLEKKSNFRIAQSLTYVNWNRKSGPLPVTFGKTDFQELSKAAKSYLFARKFDEKVDYHILDKIDSLYD